MDFEYKLAPPIGENAVFGLVTLSTDETIEHDFQRLLGGDGRAIYISRIATNSEITPENLAQMAGGITASASLLPASLEFASIGYGCTSASSVIGSDKVDTLLRKGARTEHTTNPLRALTAACAHLHVNKLAVLSPYVRSTSQALIRAFEAEGLEVQDYGSFNESDDAKVARIDPASIRDAAIKLGQTTKADALFMSCTNLRTLDIIAEIEEALDRPVLSSNQVLAWHMGAQAGSNITHKNFGRLFLQ